MALTERQLINQLQWRYAVKRFDPARKISPSQVSALEDALVLSPSSYGLQPWKFVIVSDANLKKQLRPHSWNQPQIEECSHLVVFFAQESVTQGDVDRYISRIALVRGVPEDALKDYKAMMVGDVVHGPRSKWVEEWASRQVYIALGVLMTSAAVMGIDSCPMEGIDAAKYDEILHVGGFKARVACALGYRSPNDAFAEFKKVRFPKDEVIISR